MGGLKPKNYFDEHLPKRVVLALVFAFHFMLIGWLVPELYFKYFDNTNYYTVVQPVPVDKKWYKPCDDVQVTATRTSLVNVNLDVNIELILRKDGDTIFKVPNGKVHRTATVQQGKGVTILVTYPLPCDLPPGLYYWQIIATYKVHGYDRTYLAVTDTFNVNEFGESPELLKVATQSATLKQEVPVVRPALRAATTTPTPAPTVQPVTQSQAGQSGQQTTVNNNNSQPGQEKQPTPVQNPSVIDNVLDSLRKLL